MTPSALPATSKGSLKPAPGPCPGSARAQVDTCVTFPGRFRADFGRLRHTGVHLRQGREGLALEVDLATVDRPGIGDPVEEQQPVQVVQFVLHRHGLEPVRLDRHRLT